MPTGLGLINFGITKAGHVIGVLTKTAGWQAGLFGIVQGVAAIAFLQLGGSIIDQMDCIDKMDWHLSQGAIFMECM